MRVFLGVLAIFYYVTTPATAMTDVRFTLEWTIAAGSAPVFLALDKGYFAEEGLNVTIDTGAGSRSSVPRVATGTYDMGLGDINALIQHLDRDPDLKAKAVMMVYETPALAIIGRKSLGVTTDPGSLEGKTLGAPAQDTAFALWPAFAQITGVDVSDITLNNIGFPLREPMLSQGQVDAVFAFSYSTVVNLINQGVPEDDIAVILMADHGLDLYGNAVLVNTDFAAEHPEAVKGMLRALTRGYLDAIVDPAAAVEHVISRNRILDADIEAERLKLQHRISVATPGVYREGFGDVDMDRLAASIDLLQTHLGLSDEPPSAARVFDRSYLPPLEGRMPRSSDY